jgi:hypothetical protein
VSACFAIAACLGLLWTNPLMAQVATPDGTSPQTLTYEDRLIEGGSLPPDVSAGGTSGLDGTGLPRAFHVQMISSHSGSDEYERDEDGLRLGGTLDTANYGALTLDANLRSSDGYGDNSGSLVTLYQLGLPMPGGWFVDNALGASNTPAVDLVRSQYRFYVPAFLNNGLVTEWRQGERLQLHASAGELGQMVGLYVPTFEELGGRQISAGAQWNGGDGWSVALQGADVNDSREFLGSQYESEEVSAQSWLGAVAWSKPAARAQFNVLGSSREGSSATGAWLDASLRADRTRHNGGLFYMENDLSWATRPMPDNLQGGYYRFGYQTRQWLVDGGADYVRSVAGASSDTLYATGYARYQRSSWAGYGGGGNVRDGDTTAWSVFAFLDQQNHWGIGRAQVDYASDTDRTNTQLRLDQTWRTPPSVRFSNSLLLGREEFAGESVRLVGVALNGGGNVRTDLALDLDLRWDHGSGGSDYENVLANMAVNWNFFRGWTLGANYYYNRVSTRFPLVVGPPIPGEGGMQLERIDDRGFYLNVRYDWRAGAPLLALGGSPLGGTGGVRGVLFLDENDNGRQDAGERGAAEVVVLLDGRFPARTDAEGRFEFLAVAAGTHVLKVVPDNLPLPWIHPPAEGVSVVVGIRENIFVPLAIQRLR